MHLTNRLGRLVHLLTPILVISVALAYHGLGRPIPILTLLTLISGAYGKALWHEFLENRTVTGTVQCSEAISEAIAKTTMTRDVVLGVEPTR